MDGIIQAVKGNQLRIAPSLVGDETILIIQAGKFVRTTVSAFSTLFGGYSKQEIERIVSEGVAASTRELSGEVDNQGIDIETLLLNIGNLLELSTENKTSIVAAINELADAGLGSDDIDETLAINTQNKKLGVNLTKVTSRQDFDTLVGALVPHPTYNAPTSSISTASTLIGEIGTAINGLVVNVAFNQRDGGIANGYQVKKNGNVVAVGNSYTDNIVLAATPIAYQGAVSYYDGPVKNNLIGIADAIGRILAGSALSNTINFIGYPVAWFGFGASDNAPVSSADVRALKTLDIDNQTQIPGKQLLVNAASLIFIHRTGTARTVHSIITTRTISEVKDLDNLNAVITSEYVLQGNIAVNDAAGNPVTGLKLYVKTMGVAYTSSKRHQITLV